MAILQSLGQKALEKTSSTLTNFAKGAFQAGMAEAPGIAYGYSALKGIAGKFPRSTTSSMGGSTSTTSNGVSAKESRSLIAVNMLMLREMKQTNLGIQRLNRMIGVQTALALKANMFAEERNRESELFNERLLNALKGLSLAGPGGTSTKNGGGGLLSGIADGIGTLLQILGAAGAGAIALKYGAPVLARSLAKNVRASTKLPTQPSYPKSLPSKPSTSSATKLLPAPSSSATNLARPGTSLASRTKDVVDVVDTSKVPKGGAGFMMRILGGLGLLLTPSTAAAATLDDYYKGRGPREQTDPGFVPSSPGGTDYLAKVIQAESGGQSNAQASTSSAFGLGQFTRGTFESLAASSSKDSVLYGKSFADYKKSEELQIAALQALTEQNRTRLVKAGLPSDDASLYLAHFLGAGMALRVLQSNNNIDLKNVLPASYFKANPAVFGNLKTVGDLKAWAARKMSGPVGKKAAQAAAMAGGGGGRKPPLGSQSAATDPGEIPGVTTFSGVTATTSGSGTRVDKFLQAMPVYDATADKNAKEILKKTERTASATEAGNVAMTGRKRPTSVKKSPIEIANEKFIKDFGRVTDKVFRREANELAIAIFGKDYNKGMTVAQGARKGVIGTQAGKLVGIDKAAAKIFGKDYGPVFAQLGRDYMDVGLREVGKTIFGPQMGADAEGLTGAILGNFASGNKKVAKEQMLYGLLGIPTGPQSLTMFLGGPNSPFESLKGVKNPRDLVNRIADNAAKGTQDILFGGPPGSGQSGGLFGGLFGRGGGGAGTGSGTTEAVDTFNAWETYSNESLVEQQNQTGLLERIFGANTQGNSIFGAVGTGIVKSLGAVGSSLLKGIQWLGGSLGSLLGSLFKALGGIFGGGGGSNFLNTVLNLGKSIFNVGSITDFGGSYLTNIASTALDVVGLAGTASSYAALVPGLSSAAAGSQAAMLASQTAVFGAEGLAATAAAAEVATGTAAVASGTTAAAGSFASSLAAAAPYLAVAAVVFSLFSKKSTPKLERGIVIQGNNDINAKFDINNINMDPRKDLYKQIQPFLDSLLNVVFSAVKNIQAKTKAEPPMLAIGMRYTHKDKKLMMKLYTPNETIGGDPKWKKYYGVLDQSFKGASVAAEMVKDIQAYYSEGKDESAVTAITEATNEITSTSFQTLTSGQFTGLSTLDQTAPVGEQAKELANMIKTNFQNLPGTISEDDSGYATFYNPLTGKYEKYTAIGQLGFDSQGRAIVDVNANNRIDLEDIQRSQAAHEKSAVEAFMNNYNQNNYDHQINYNEALRMSLAAMWQEANYDPYSNGA